MPNALTDMQRVILANAAAHAHRRVMPTPTSLNKNAGAIALSLRSIMANGLIAEVPAEPGEPIWGTSSDGAPTILIISNAGLAEMGLPEAEDTGAVETPLPTTSPSSPRAGTKLASMIDLLSRSDGATIDELVDATGWQKHSVRGAMSGALKTKHGLELTSETQEGRGRVYCIAVSTAANRAEVAASAAGHEQ